MPPLMRNLVQRTAGLGLVAVAALALGLLQEVLLARRFGTGPAADAYAAALLLPTVLMTILGNAASAAYLACHAGRDGEGAAFVRSVLLIAIAAAAILALFAPPLVAWVYSGFPPQTAALTVSLLRSLSLVAAAGSLFALLKARFNARGTFMRPAAAGLLVPAACSSALLLGASVESVALAVAAAWLVQALLLAAGGHWRGSGTTDREWSLALPLMAVALLGFAYQPIGRAIASRLIDGGVAALRYSDNILQLPVALVYLPLATVVLPSLSAHALNGRTESFRELYGEALRWVVRAGLCIAALIWALSGTLVAAIYRGGAFGVDSSALVTRLLTAGALFALPWALTSLSTPALIALQRIRTLLGLSALFCTINLLLLILLVPWLGLVGVVLAGALAACCSESCALALLVRCDRARLDAAQWRSTWRALLGALAAALAAHAAQLACARFTGPRLSLLIAGAVGVAVFLPIALTGLELRGTLGALVTKMRSQHS
jgi:putative peptidoglycan lipid II flippase